MNIIVVGAGIAGLSTAWSLVKAGHSVTLLEQGAAIPNPLAASGDHHRIIRRAYRASSGYGALIGEAYDAWSEMWDDLGENHLDARGFLCVSLEPGDKIDEYLEGMNEGGWPYDMLDPAATTERFPFLDPDTFRYAYFSGEGGALHCRRIAACLAGWLSAHGANVYTGSKAVAIDPDDGRVELETGETLRADRIVVTAGAWVTKLFPELSGRLKTYRTAVAYVEPPADLRAAWETAPVMMTGGRADGYLIPFSGGAGMKFGANIHKVPTSDADWNREAVEGEGEAIRNLFAAPFARIGEYRVTEVVTCAYTFTHDERFFAHEKGRALIISACSGHGYKFGAAVGQRVSRAIGDGDVAALERWLRAEVG